MCTHKTMLGGVRWLTKTRYINAVDCSNGDDNVLTRVREKAKQTSNVQTNNPENFSSLKLALGRKRAAGGRDKNENTKGTSRASEQFPST